MEQYFRRKIFRNSKGKQGNKGTAFKNRLIPRKKGEIGLVRSNLPGIPKKNHLKHNRGHDRIDVYVPNFYIKRASTTFHLDGALKFFKI